MTDKSPDPDRLITKAVYDHPAMSWEEKAAVIRSIQHGSNHGFGNIMAWLAAAWAIRLRDVHGMSEDAAIHHVSNRGPYPLPKKP